MEPKKVINALERAKQINQEQQEWWDAFDDLWGESTSHEKYKEYCLQDDVDDFIIQKIADALKECNNNKSHAANKLGLKRETLLAKMKKYRIF